MTSAQVPSKDKERLQVYVPQELMKRIDALVSEAGTSRSELVERVLSAALAEGAVIVDLQKEQNQKLQELSKHEHRSVEQQATVLLIEGLENR